MLQDTIGGRGLSGCECACRVSLDVFLHKYAFAVSFAILAACYVAVAKIDSPLYQGVIARKKYYVDGEWIFYLARQAILYESDKYGIYCLFEQRMLSCVSENMEKSAWRQSSICI